MPPEEVVAEKQTLLTKLHNFEKKEELEPKKTVSFEEKKIEPVIEPPKPPPQKVEVRHYNWGIFFFIQVIISLQ